MKWKVASQGYARGIACCFQESGEPMNKFFHESIIIAFRTTPALTPYLINSRGLILIKGGILAHAAQLCRELGIPCFINVPGVFAKSCCGKMIEIDTKSETIRIMNPVLKRKE